MFSPKDLPVFGLLLHEDGKLNSEFSAKFPLCFSRCSVKGRNLQVSFWTNGIRANRIPKGWSGGGISVHNCRNSKARREGQPLLKSNPDRGIRIDVPKPSVRRECRKPGKRLRRDKD